MPEVRILNIDIRQQDDNSRKPFDGKDISGRVRSPNFPVTQPTNLNRQPEIGRKPIDRIRPTNHQVIM